MLRDMAEGDAEEGHDFWTTLIVLRESALAKESKQIP